MKLFLYICILSLLFSSCLRLDDLLFNNEPLTEYQFENYTGNKILGSLPDSFAIAHNKRHLFTLTSVSSKSSATIYAVYIGDLITISTDTVIVYCHGTGKHMDNYWNRAQLLANIGHKYRFGVLMMDYRGYGKSGGEPTEENMYADVDACLKWLKSNGVTNNRLVIYGYSLGSAPACKLAANTYSLKPSKLILESPFASAAVMVDDGSGLALPASYLTNLKISNAEEIKKVTQPFLWMHGIDDDFLNIKTHGEVVYKNYKGIYSEAHRIPNAKHENVPEIWGYTNYLDALTSFMER
jgi:pimeloyl-ACP methyl ester carboxylesterase